MKILLCTPQPISQYLGVSRVLIELQSQMIKSGHDVTLIGPKELGITEEKFTNQDYRINYQNKLREYLINNADLYDVVDYDHEFLPFDRSEFCKDTLFVTRTVLLTQHLRHINPPRPFSLRRFIGQIKSSKKRTKRLSDADLTILNADLINVPNKQDAEYLIKNGTPKNKICVIPYGISDQRREDFRKCASTPPNSLKIVFLGSFDYRKGAMDFSYIINEILKSKPDAKFLFLGTKGLFNSKEEILNFFEPKSHKHIEVIMSFKREEIGEYLKECSLGIYPSYMEGFPFGILEMQTAYIPVYAYDSPGAGMMLPSCNLSPPGDKEDLAFKIIEHIKKKNTKQKRQEVFQSSLQFNWKSVCQTTIEIYKKFI
jgi:glycosyltransferase involved in cell wall biosynthesis